MSYGPEIFLTDEERRERRNLVQLEVSQIEEERRREDDACKHAEQRSVEREEAMKISDLNIEKNDEGSRVVKDEIGGLRSGQRVRVLEDADESGPYAGTYADDEGELQIEVVGSPEYGNERVSFGIKTEIHDEFIDVDPENIEAI